MKELAYQTNLFYHKELLNLSSFLPPLSFLSPFSLPLSSLFATAPSLSSDPQQKDSQTPDTSVAKETKTEQPQQQQQHGYAPSIRPYINYYT